MLQGFFSCLFDSSLVGNETESYGNLIIFLANAMHIPWLELVQNPCHIWAWKTNKTCINDMMESPWNLVMISTKLPSICDMKWHGISMRLRVIFFKGKLPIRYSLFTYLPRDCFPGWTRKSRAVHKFPWRMKTGILVSPWTVPGIRIIFRMNPSSVTMSWLSNG